MTITINTHTIIRSCIIFAAGVVFSDKVKKKAKKVRRNVTSKVSNKAKDLVGRKTEEAKNDILRRVRNAFDTDADVIDIPIRWGGLMRRSYKYNKYTLTKYDSLEERLKRSNKSPFERMAELVAKYEEKYLVSSEVLKNADISEYESKPAFKLSDIYDKMNGGDNNENRKNT